MSIYLIIYTFVCPVTMSLVSLSPSRCPRVACHSSRRHVAPYRAVCIVVCHPSCHPVASL